MEKRKIGTFMGVFVPNVTMMFGVILFLRLGIIVAHAGMIPTIMIIGLSLLIMLLTSASSATLATNMKVGDGGVYYIITRSLGIEAGGALGFILYINQLLCIVMTISGFAYTVKEAYPMVDIRIVEAITLILLASLSSVSSKTALQVQVLILLILLISVVAIFFGSRSYLTTPEVQSSFFPGGILSFWQGFSLLYVAFTGIEAGMALSGNLKNPARSLMIGNITSLLFAGIVYTSIIVYAYFNIPHNSLLTDPFIFIKYAKPNWLVTLGIYVATLSSALGSLLAAPRILQSMSKDKLVSTLFSKEYGVYREPRWALLFTTVIALFIMLITSIDLIIPIYSMVCLISYGLLNFAAGVSSLINAPSWRPKFHFPYWASFIGSLLCFISMFMVEAGWSFLAILIFLFFYFLLYKRQIKATFQDLRACLESIENIS